MKRIAAQEFARCRYKARRCSSRAGRGIGLAIAVRATRRRRQCNRHHRPTAPSRIKLPGTIYSAAGDREGRRQGAADFLRIREEAQVAEAVEKTVAAFGGIDICVNNASAINLTGTLQTDMKRYDLMHQINTHGTPSWSRKCAFRT